MGMAKYRWGMPNCESNTAALCTLLAEAFFSRSPHFLAEYQVEKLLSFIFLLGGKLPKHLQQNTRAFQQ